MAAPWTLTVRSGPAVAHERHPSLDEALAAARAHVAALRQNASRPTRQVLGREYDPVSQVAARVELRRRRLRGPHGGVDVRGDGSTEAWAGLVRKRLLTPADGEDLWSSLERALTDAR
jgi:hypothetical protein